MSRLLFALLTASLLSTSLAQAALSPAWITTYTSGNTFSPRGLAVDADGNSYIVSTIRVVNTDDDIAVTKFDADGNFVWQSIYTGPVEQDLAVDIELSADQSAIYAVGRSGVPGFGNSDYAVIKYDAQSGAEIWTRYFNGPASGIDDPRQAVATPDGGIAVTGGVWNDDERYDFGTVKYDAAGNKTWDATFGDNGPFLFNNDFGRVIAVTPEGDVVVSGLARPATSGDDVVTFKYDGQTGAQLWMARYSSSANETVSDIAIAPNGDVVIFGTDPFGIDRQWLVARYDGATGAEQWVALFDPGFDENARAMALDTTGNVYVTGATDPDGDDGNFNENLIVLSFDGATGNFRWIFQFGADGINEADFGNDLVVDDQGRLFVLGTSRSDFVVTHDFDADAVIFELDPSTGLELDFDSVDTTEPGDFTRTDSYNEVGLDAAGNLYLRGMSAGDVFVEPRVLMARYSIGRLPGDIDGDGDVDLMDTAAFYNCMTGPGTPYPQGCDSSDIDGDGDADLQDFSQLQAPFAGF